MCLGMCDCLSIYAHHHTLTHPPLIPIITMSPVLVSTSLLVPCLCLCELLGSCCGCVLWDASVMCLGM